MNREYLTRQEVADLLGITRKTCDRLIAKGEIKAIKIGSAVRIHRDEIEAFRARGGTR